MDYPASVSFEHNKQKPEVNKSAHFNVPSTMSFACSKQDLTKAKQFFLQHFLVNKYGQ